MHTSGHKDSTDTEKTYTGHYLSGYAQRVGGMIKRIYDKKTCHRSYCRTHTNKYMGPHARRSSLSFAVGAYYPTQHKSKQQSYSHSDIIEVS